MMTTHFPPFPVAAHSYFIATNKEEARKAFIADDITQPVFVYRSNYSLPIVTQRIPQVVGTPWEHSLKLVERSILLQKDDSKLDDFRVLNQALFGIPTKAHAAAILRRLASKVTPETDELWDEVVEMIGEAKFEATADSPSPEVFSIYHDYLKKYLGEHFDESGNLHDLIEKHLQLSGLAAQGWRIKKTEGKLPARTNHRKKCISIGEEYEPRSKAAVMRIVLHEVYGHALRGPQKSVAEAEGFAIVLEQLTSPTFKFRRAYRYLAVALGWGVFERPRTFREVYEILWRLMVIGSHYSQEIAKNYAFDECYRAFRGGRPDLAGAVFLKDSTYFEANLTMWKSLSQHIFSYNEFIDCIEGRRALL